MNPIYILRDSKTAIPQPITLVINHNNRKLRFGLKEKISPQFWDFDLQEPIPYTTIPRRLKESDRSLKAKLKKIRMKQGMILDVLGDFAGNKFVKLSEVKAALTKKLRPNEIPTSNTETGFKDYIQSVVNDMLSGERLKDRDLQTKYSRTTITDYTGLHNTIDNYERQVSENLTSRQKARILKDKRKKGLPKIKKRLRFTDLDANFENDFKKFLRNLDCKPNTVGKRIKQIKSIMEMSRAEGLHNNLAYQNFKVTQVPAMAIYLTKKELEKFSRTKIEKKLEPHRDLFLLGVYTGQRFSDYTKLNKSMLTETSKGTKVLKLIQKKTKKEVTIPISPLVNEILNKYDKLPKVTNAEHNEAIREIARLSELTQSVTLTNAAETVTGLKYQFLASHSARRSGLTLMSQAGITPNELIKISGHSKIKDLQTYLKTTPDEVADKVATNTFFTQEPIKKSPLKIVGNG